METSKKDETSAKVPSDPASSKGDLVWSEEVHGV